MKEYSAKILLGAITVIIVSGTLQAQGFAGGVSIKAFQPSLSRTIGHFEDGSASMGESMAIDLFGEFRFISGLTVHSELGWQHEDAYLSMCSPDGICGGNGKSIQSLIISGGIGYIKRVGESPFYTYASVAAGVGGKYLHDMDKEKSMDDVGGWYDPMTGASGIDTMHYYSCIIDEDLPKVDMQFRVSLGGEYRKKQFFLRVFLEARHWARRVVQAQYVIERNFVQHSDPFTPYTKQHATGNYFIRAGYVGGGITAGWYFGTTQ